MVWGSVQTVRNPGRLLLAVPRPAPLSRRRQQGKARSGALLLLQQRQAAEQHRQAAHQQRPMHHWLAPAPGFGHQLFHG